MSPAHFEEELKEKVFTKDSDVKICADLYRGVAEPLLAAVEKLEFKELAWTAADWRHMGGALACCTKLRQLDLYHGRGRCGDGGVRRRARQRRGARAQGLDLEGNKIGDEGMRHLGDALARGAAPALKSGLEGLGDNKIGDEGLRHLGDALARGAAPALEALWLSNNKIGDEGVRHLGDALARGAAPALEELT